MKTLPETHKQNCSVFFFFLRLSDKIKAPLKIRIERIKQIKNEQSLNIQILNTKGSNSVSGF